MFKDYYTILEVDENATSEEIKTAFKNLAKKWHPDKNPGIDTTKVMQDINEAYLFLKDNKARAKYDIEYQRFKGYKDKHSSTEPANNSKGKTGSNNYEYPGYSIFDEDIKKWMNNAARQAIELAKITIRETRILMGEGVKQAGSEIGKYLVPVVIVSIIGIILFLIYVNNLESKSVGVTQNDTGATSGGATLVSHPNIGIGQNNKNESSDKNEFRSLNPILFGYRLFNGIKISDKNEIIWKPDKVDMKSFPISSDGMCYTVFDTAFYFIDEAQSYYMKKDQKKSIVILFATYKKGKNGNYLNCHVCSPLISYAVFTQNNSGSWDLKKFRKSLVHFGSWGISSYQDYGLQPKVISFVKYGKAKYAFNLSGYYAAQGYISEWLSYFDFVKGRYIFDTNAETILNPGIDDNNPYEYKIKSRFLPSLDEYYDMEVIREGLIRKDSSKAKPIKIIQTYSFNLDSQKYVLSDKIVKHQEGYQYFRDFKIKWKDSLKLNEKFIKDVQTKGNASIVTALIATSNIRNPDSVYILNVNSYDESKTFNAIPVSKYSLFEDKFLVQYAKNLSQNGIEYQYANYKGERGIEYKFSRMNIPTRALYFFHNKRTYLLQISSSKNLYEKFDKLLKSFEFY